MSTWPSARRPSDASTVTATGCSAPPSGPRRYGTCSAPPIAPRPQRSHSAPCPKTAPATLVLPSLRWPFAQASGPAGRGQWLCAYVEELLDLAADLCIWLSAFDDLHVEAPQATAATLAPHIASFTHVLDTRTTPSASPSPLTSALADLTRRMHDLMTPAQAARTTGRLHQALAATYWETTAHGRIVGLAEYEAMRPHTFFGHTLATLIEPCAGLDLPAQVHHCEPVRHLIHGTARLWGWINDVYSFPMERDRLGTPPQTLPLILTREHGLSLPEAFTEVCRLCDREASTAHRLVTELTSSPVPQLPDYARAISHAIGGTQTVYQVSDRWRTHLTGT